MEGASLGKVNVVQVLRVMSKGLSAPEQFAVLPGSRRNFAFGHSRSVCEIHQGALQDTFLHGPIKLHFGTIELDLVFLCRVADWRSFDQGNP